MSIAIEKTRTTFGKAAILSGLIAGTVFLILELIMVPLFLGDSPWAPPRMIAAIIMGRDVLPSPTNPATFNLVMFLAAAVVHFTLSAIYATVIAEVCKKRGMGASLLIGALAGLAIYILNFYAFTEIFPWFAMARNWVSIFAHVVFGVVAAYSFVKIYHPSSQS